jgi:sugar/nucleoside kinase (ribokinase family)
MGATERTVEGLQFDYTAVGHVTIDVMEDGARRAGGTAFYSALQAARLGRRTLIVTRGVPAEIEELLEPHAAEIELAVEPARETTTLLTSGAGAMRKQQVLAWAGPIADGLAFDTEILHLAPIARETPSSWRGRTGFLGLTPQGLVREWTLPGGEISIAAPGDKPRPIEHGRSPEPPRRGRARTSPPEAVGACDGLVVSELELAGCAEVVARARAAGAVTAVTAGPAPTRLLLPDGSQVAVAVPDLQDPVEDLGAGDVFAAAFFIALAESGEAQSAAAFANAAAAVRMSGHGAHAIGDRAAVEARLLGAARGHR